MARSPLVSGFARRWAPSLDGSEDVVENALPQAAPSPGASRPRPPALAVVSNGRTPDGRRQIAVRPEALIAARATIRGPGGVSAAWRPAQRRGASSRQNAGLRALRLPDGAASGSAASLRASSSSQAVVKRP